MAGHMQRGTQQLSHMQSLLCFLTSILQKDQLSSSKRNHEPVGSGVVQTSTCSGVIFSRPWNIQYPHWVSRSSGQIASCFSSWPNSLSQENKNVSRETWMYLSSKWLVMVSTLLLQLFYPSDRAAWKVEDSLKRVDYSCLRSWKFLCILSL